MPNAVKGHSHNEDIVTIIQDIVKAYGKFDSSSIVPEVEKIELILPEKADADVEGVVHQQESLPIGHVSFHAHLLVPERIETSKEFKLKDDLLAVLQSEEHTSELQSLAYLVCRLLLEKKKTSKSDNQT